MKVSRTGAPAWTSSKPPLLRFLNACHTEYAADSSGAVADYIPELG
jgi:glutaminase